MEINHRFFTINEACRELRISRATLHRRLKDGQVPSKKIGSRVLIPWQFFENLAKIPITSVKTVGEK